MLLCIWYLHKEHAELQQWRHYLQVSVDPVMRSGGKSVAMSATAFADLLETVPDMLRYLSRSSKRALLATNKAFWQQIQQGTTTISIMDHGGADQDICLLVKGTRHQLRRLDLADMSDEGRSPTATSVCHATIQAILSQGQWPFLTRLTMTRDLLIDDADSNDCLHFVDAAWRLLEHLDLTGNILHLDNWVRLATDWPHLKTLNLTWYGADSAKLASLAQNKWLQLENLDLSMQNLDVECVKYLSVAHWPHLKNLSLNTCALNDDSIPFLAMGAWPALERLDLQQNFELTNKSVEDLITASWPNMQYLRLGTVSTQRLFQKWPGLKNWHFQGRMPLGVVQEVALAGMSHLRDVCLPQCRLDSKALKLMSQAHWPALESCRCISVVCQSSMAQAEFSELEWCTP